MEGMNINPSVTFFGHLGLSNILRAKSLMPDKYSNFSQLASAESDRAYAVVTKDLGSSVAIAAPHGGGIEPGTSEIALTIAGSDLSLYMFEGIKANGNSDLHITSTKFDEPQCLKLLQSAEVVVTVHGEASDDEIVYLGGLHKAGVASISASLASCDFTIREHTNPSLQGLHLRNICNIGRTGKGVQLEISSGLRRIFFASLTRDGRMRATPRLSEFCDSVRKGLQFNGL